MHQATDTAACDSFVKSNIASVFDAAWSTSVQIMHRHRSASATIVWSPQEYAGFARGGCHEIFLTVHFPLAVSARGMSDSMYGSAASTDRLR